MTSDSIDGPAAALTELPGWSGTDEEAKHQAPQIVWQSRLSRMNCIKRATHTRQRNGQFKELDRIARAALEMVN